MFQSRPPRHSHALSIDPHTFLQLLLSEVNASCSAYSLLVRLEANRNMILLKAGGARTVVEEDEARSVCARFIDELERFGECHTLDISCRAWRPQSLKILHPVLVKIKPTLKVLLIDDIIASLPTDEGLACFEYIAEIFSDASQLTRVNLNDNAIGSRGIQCLRPLLTNPSVTSLSLQNCGLAEADGEVLKKLLTADGTGRTLRELSLGRNQMGSAGAEHIGSLLGSESSIPLQLFSYLGSRPLKTGTRALCRGLAILADLCGPKGTMVHTLDLNDCCVGSDEDDPIVDLCAFLRNSPRLQKLTLRDGELNVSGLAMVLDALQASGAPLTVLDLGAVGELGEEGGGQIIRDFLLANGPASASLQELKLDTNELGDEGVATIVTGIAASCRSLQILDISQNELVGIAGHLRHNHIATLQELKMDDNLDLEPNEDLQILRGMYREVTVDEELDDNGDGDVDEAADDLDGNTEVALTELLDMTHIK